MDKSNSWGKSQGQDAGVDDPVKGCVARSQNFICYIAQREIAGSVGPACPTDLVLLRLLNIEQLHPFAFHAHEILERGILGISIREPSCKHPFGHLQPFSGEADSSTCFLRFLLSAVGVSPKE